MKTEDDEHDRHRGDRNGIGVGVRIAYVSAFLSFSGKNFPY
jgi:hypothetical protein